MIKVSTKITGLDKLAGALQSHLKRTLPLELREKILLEEGQPVADMMTAKAPRGPHDPHAAEFIRVTPVRPEDSITGTRNQQAAKAAQLKPSDTATVAIGVVDVPGKEDRGWVLQFPEYGTRHRAARPFLRPTADVELPRMLDRVSARVAQELAK